MVKDKQKPPEVTKEELITTTKETFKKWQEEFTLTTEILEFLSTDKKLRQKLSDNASAKYRALRMPDKPSQVGIDRRLVNNFNNLLVDCFKTGLATTIVVAPSQEPEKEYINQEIVQKYGEITDAGWAFTAVQQRQDDKSIIMFSTRLLIGSLDIYDMSKPESNFIAMVPPDQIVSLIITQP